MSIQYKIFGLTIASEFPFFDMPIVQGPPDVTICRGNVPAAIQNPCKVGVRYQAGPGKFLLHVDNVARFYVTGGSRIVVQPHRSASDDEVLLFLMGSAMGALLHQRQMLTLHAACIAVDGQGVVLMGPSSIGKSALAAAFHDRGYQLLADDVCAISSQNGNGPMIVPGFPRLKLWSDTLERLGKSATGLKKIRHRVDFEKFFFPAEMCSRPLPVKTLFLLKSSNTDHFALTEHKGMQKIEPIIDHTYRPAFLEGLGEKRSHFLHCAAVAKAANVFTITRPQKGFRLKELMDLVQENW